MLIASFTLEDYCSNKYTLDVRKTDDGEINYSLYGQQSRIPFSLGNLGLKFPLPRHTSTCRDIIESVRLAINSGYNKIVNEEIYPQDTLKEIKKLLRHLTKEERRELLVVLSDTNNI